MDGRKVGCERPARGLRRAAPAEDFIPPELQGQPAIAIIGCHRGGSDEAEAALAPLRTLGPAADLFGPMPYPALQSMFDAELPPGRRYYFRGGFLPALTTGVAATIEEHLALKPSAFDEVDLHHMGGVAARVEPAATSLLHTQATVPWLSITEAPIDLRWQALTLARHAAGDRDTAAPAGLVAAASARVGLAAGAFDLAQAALDAVTVPTNTTETMQLAGFLSLRRSIVAAADGQPDEVDASVDYATELAGRTGEGNAYGLGFGPIKVGLYRMAGLLEVGDNERAAALAESLNPEAHVNRSGQAAYWADYGRALARTRGRQSDAVMALRRAELISPHRIQRGPVVREVLAELLARSRRDAAGRELRGMAYRAGLPV